MNNILVKTAFIGVVITGSMFVSCSAAEWLCKWRNGNLYKSRVVTYGQSAYEYCEPQKGDEYSFKWCVEEDYPASVKAIKEKRCREIVPQKFKIGESTCIVKYLKPDFELYSKDCQGPDSENALIELEQIINRK